MASNEFDLNNPADLQQKLQQMSASGSPSPAALAELNKLKDNADLFAAALIHFYITKMVQDQQLKASGGYAALRAMMDEQPLSDVERAQALSQLQGVLRVLRDLPSSSPIFQAFDVYVWQLAQQNQLTPELHLAQQRSNVLQRAVASGSGQLQQLWDAVRGGLAKVAGSVWASAVSFMGGIGRANQKAAALAVQAAATAKTSLGMGMGSSGIREDDEAEGSFAQAARRVMHPQPKKPTEA